MEVSNRDDRYIHFPLCLLQSTYENPVKGLNLILGFGIVNYAKKFEYTITEVGRQLMYAYYRKENLIHADLKRMMQRYIDNEELSIDEDYNGFIGGNFEPDNLSELLSLFESNEEFKQAAIIRYQITQAADSLNIKIVTVDNVIKNYHEGLNIKNSFEQKFGSDSCPSVKPGMLFEFRDSLTDLDLFRAYIGIKSMIGQRKFISTNKPAILSRMIGCKNKAAFEHFSKDKNLMPTVKKYSKRNQMDNLRFTLAQRGFIMFLSKPKVSIFYVSKYMEPEQLGQLIKESKSKLNLKSRMKAISASL
ncbi:MAG: hypothetical protein AB9834_23865 [Lentimicrobium sp.]